MFTHTHIRAHISQMYTDFKYLLGNCALMNIATFGANKTLF